jgi:hypothetical protein
MTMDSWIRKLFARPPRKGPRRARLAVEALERRLVPTFTVTNLLDDGSVGSLRWAVGQANMAGGDQSIDFDPTVFATPQTITLSGTQLELTDTTGTETIVGPAVGVTVSGNNASRVFQIDGGVTTSISGLTISGGDARSGNGGGLSNLGTTTLTDCTVSGNSAFSGGGLNNTGMLTLTNCTVSGNSATINFYPAAGGGGLANFGTLTLTDCTVSGNSAVNVGGGLDNIHATMTLTNCTVSGNSTRGFGFGSGLHNSSGSMTTLTNTIVAGNSGGGVTDISGAFTGTNNLIGGNPLLAPLGNYGGPTQTMALLPGSPAIDAGTTGAGIPTTDQRGLGRVGAVDIGAFESQGFTLATAPGSSPQTSEILTGFANPLAVTVAANNPIEPVNGGVVRFVNDPVNGAAAVLAAPSAVIAGGQAAVAAGPNNAVGSYTVDASATGSSPVSFALTNTGQTLPSLVVNTPSAAFFPGAGLLSLFEAIGFANLDSAGISTITFDPTVFATAQTITLTGTPLELSNTSETETITGPAAGVTVSGGGLSRVFQIDQNVTASISGLTIIRGNFSGDVGGGGLANYGTTTLTNCTISGNSVSGYVGGGGVNNTGALSLTNCTVSSNTASGFYGSGGGINNTGALSLTNCTVSGNTASGFYGSGGGINNTGALSLTHCAVSGNSASGYYGTGGGIGNTGHLSLTNCTVSGNSTGFDGFGGGLFLGGTNTLTDCTVSGNSADLGGGLANGGGTVTLRDCTVSGNSGFVGGGVNSLGGTTTLTDCTVSGNGASFGGGLSAQVGTTTLTDCTVSGNSAARGGGLYNFGPTRLTLSNTIVAANSSDILGNVNANSSYNLIGTGGSGGLIDGVNHNQVGVANPGLGTLGDHGGPTQTINLLGGSPALNAGDPAQLGLADQRGVVRSGGVNIGAYQASATAFVLTAPGTVTAGVPFDVTVTAVDPLNQVVVGYTGTVTFGTTDTDPGVVLPADYAFVPSDGGMHRFTDTGLGEVTLVTPGDQMLTVMDTAVSTITGSADLTVSAGPAPHGHGPPRRTVPARPAQSEGPAPRQPSASEVVGLERWFASLHDGDYVWLTVPRLRHQARGDTTLGMADLFGGDDLLFL